MSLIAISPLDSFCCAGHGEGAAVEGKPTDSWLIPSKHFRQLLETLKSDMADADIQCKGDSETLKKYFHEKKIDPKFDCRYQHFYVNRCHTAAVSYTW
jgi:hypothetical protein